MNKNSKRLALATAVAAVFALTAVVLRALACTRYLESNLIYFSNYGLVNAAGSVLIVGIVAAVAIALTTEKEPLRASFSSPLTFIPTGLVAVSLLIFGIVMLALYVSITPPLPSKNADIAKGLALMTAILAPLSAVHFFLSALLTERHARLRAYFALATVLLGALYASFLYFNQGTPINAPNKLVEQMAYLFASIFFLYETRISLGREMWRGYTVFGLIAAALTAYASVPAVITYLAVGKRVTATVESAALLAAFSVFILARMIMTALASPDRECPEMAALRKFAERREEEMLTGKIEDGEQISITELIDIPKARPVAEGDDEPDGDSAADADENKTETKEADE